MSPMAVNIHPAGCRGKVRYGTRATAKRCSKTIKQVHADKLHPYYCELCDGWHLGHRKGQQ